MDKSPYFWTFELALGGLDYIIGDDNRGFFERHATDLDHKSRTIHFDCFISFDCTVSYKQTITLTLPVIDRDEQTTPISQCMLISLHREHWFCARHELKNCGLWFRLGLGGLRVSQTGTTWLHHCSQWGNSIQYRHLSHLKKSAQTSQKLYTGKKFRKRQAVFFLSSTCWTSVDFLMYSYVNSVIKLLPYIFLQLM